ncbi:Fungal Zn(2)-Cys(6) binuclear cluster domain-containing protein [Penicillium ucsense]|uniref:Xylanolytic transcriptional activator xlnR n=1 Tax=Penicillium ucsense TaxID=2839758 RepID=A0A8J8W7W5_9EURO|nr:Fungal Zn(2)-Cys(6) binuclear cluster domain-containing protein [Penicillium ucsense]KAF7736817.1 Fungal Zn(2)-Cys(6) binuclear cluster domain-containing protein [Penicillium ucsense]
MKATGGHKGQPRVLRACDSCTYAKQRCDGQQPCRRCAERKEDCRFTKEVRKRGRRPRNSLGHVHRADDMDGDRKSPKTQSASPHDTILSSGTSTQEGLSVESSLDRRSYLTSPPAADKLSGKDPVYQKRDDFLNGMFPTPKTSVRLEPLQNVMSPTHISLDHRGSLPSIHQAVFDNVPGPPSDPFTLRTPYRCLESVLPRLSGILLAEEASEMLEIFFNEKHNSMFKSTSPYMLAHVLHPSSVLHPTDPRPTSPALITVILFCVTQTADMRIFDTPGARERTSVDLYRLSMDLLQSEDPDNYFRTSDGWQFHPHPSTGPPSNSHTAPDRQSSGTALLPRQLGSTDTILAVAILTIVISGGHYKADALKWRDKLIRLVRASGLSMEDQDIDLGPVFCGLYNGDATFRRWMVAKEERRRLFWLIYCLDRHLALSFNMRTSIAEGTFCVRTPLPEKLWQTLDTVDLNNVPANGLGPPSQISGTGFFEYFLPLARVLGHIIDLHHLKAHPTLGRFIPLEAIQHIETMIAQRAQEVNDLENHAEPTYPNDSAARSYPPSSDAGIPPRVDSYGSPSATMTKDSKVQLVKIYSSYLLHVFYILLHGKWDPISMIEDRDDWITSESFVTCASHALSASGVVSQILTIDPEMTFMPYLFGVYLLQGSFILLLFVDRMPELGPNRSVEEVCETIIRAHEVSVVTLDTTFQKNFRKVFRSMLYDAQQAGPHSWDEHKARRRELLSLYRWTPLAQGLAY